MQTTLPFILEILIPYRRVACLMNILNDFTVRQIIYESNMVKKECYDLAPNEIQYACKQHQSLCYNSLGVYISQSQSPGLSYTLLP